MHVLFVVNNFPYDARPADGVFNLRQLQAMRDRGIGVSVVRIAPRGASWLKSRRQYRTLPDAYVVDGIPVRVVRGLLGPRSTGMTTMRLQTAGSLRRAVEEFEPTLVHAHGLLPAGFAAGAVDRPLIVTAHGSETYRLPWMHSELNRAARAAVARADGLAAVSNFVADHLRELGAQRVSVIYNGADSATFFPRSRSEARQRLGIDGERRVIAFAGHLMKEKGVNELLAAAQMLRAHRPLLALAGVGPLAEELRVRASATGVDLRLYGQVSHEKLAEIFAAADVVTLPSYAEGLPAAVCEAMMSERAVVASAVGGIPEIVHDESTGFAVPPRDARALAGALERVLDDAVLRERMECNAGAFARERLTWEANVDAYLTLYDRILLTDRSRRSTGVTDASSSRAATGRR